MTPATDHPDPHAASDDPLDVLIVGAGLSGIGMAVHLTERLPGKTFAILEARAALGGTWDLFRYPGIRSDSDMHTLGFVFEPWTEAKAIADGPSILAYLNRIVDERGLRGAIRFRHRATGAAFDSATGLWTVTVAGPDGAAREMRARFLYMASGYYDYDEAHRPELPGVEAFEGPVVHPQFWPDGLEVAGRRVTVIGSGATAVTLVPSLAKRGAVVTMLQRTPTWYIIRPSVDRIANGLRRLIGDKAAYALVRFRNVRMQQWLFRRARRDPRRVGDYLTKQVAKALGGRITDPAAFAPPYGPWEQRLCLVPDNDLFDALKDGAARIVTDRIARIDANGIVLERGGRIDSDVLVTATGLKLSVAGKVAFRVDGRPVNFAERFYYKGCMFSNVPNMATVFGYLNASWTLKADLVSAYVCRVIAAMDAAGAAIAWPFAAEGSIEPAEATFDFSSGYVQRSLAFLPRSGRDAPWRLNQDYLLDRRILLRDPVEDGHLRLSPAGAAPTDAVDRTDASQPA